MFLSWSNFRSVLRPVVRSTRTFLQNNMFTPMNSDVLRDSNTTGTSTKLNGTKKCFITSSRGNYSWNTLTHISKRLHIQSRLSMDMYFFECTDITKFPRNCQNVICFISVPEHRDHKLGCVVYLPPCASFLYYLEWKGKLKNSLPGLVFYTEETSIAKQFYFHLSFARYILLL